MPLGAKIMPKSGIGTANPYFRPSFGFIPTQENKPFKRITKNNQRRSPTPCPRASGTVALPGLTPSQPTAPKYGIAVQSYGIAVQPIWDTGAQIWDIGAIAPTAGPSCSHFKKTEESLRPTAKMIYLRPSTTNDKTSH